MDYQYVFKRAGHIVWRYKALWIFGFLVALTTCNGAYTGSDSSNVSYRLDDQDWAELRGLDTVGPAFEELEQLLREPTADEILSTVLAIVLVIAGIAVLWIILASVLRYVGDTALIKMVNDYEKTGDKLSIRQGFRTGWSRTAWRFFLIDLLVRLPVTLAFIGLFGLALVPLLLWFTGVTEAGVTGTVISIGLFVPLIFLAIAVNTVLALLTQFFRRVCALEDKGVLASIGQGTRMVLQNLKEAVLVGLMMLGITIAWVMALIPISILLIPVVLLLLVPGLLLGGGAALITGGLTSLLIDGLLPWIVAGAVGVPILGVTLVLPWVFAWGLWEVYVSSAWTLTYRQLRELSLAKEKVPVDPDLAELGAMPAKG